MFLGTLKRTLAAIIHRRAAFAAKEAVQIVALRLLMLITIALFFFFFFFFTGQFSHSGSHMFIHVHMSFSTFDHPGY